MGVALFRLALAGMIFLGSLTPLPVRAEAMPASIPELPRLYGVTVHPQDPFMLDFLVAPGLLSPPGGDMRQDQARLVRYFLTALTVPDRDQWVNLSPYEQGRTIDPRFGLTEMGRALLEQDLELKKLCARLTSPDSPTGQVFWRRVYQQAREHSMAMDMPVDAFTKVWIVPEDAEVWQQGLSAYVTNIRLKVLAESDYLALSRREGGGAAAGDEPVRGMMREIVLPEISREINEGAAFAPLRRVVGAMVLATWYKRALQDGIFNQMYADRGLVAGVDAASAGAPPELLPRQVYEAYLETIRRGVFSGIREEMDPLTGEVVPRKYFSGGFDRSQAEVRVVEGDVPGDRPDSLLAGSMTRLGVQLRPFGTGELRRRVLALLSAVVLGGGPGFFVDGGSAHAADSLPDVPAVSAIFAQGTGIAVEKRSMERSLRKEEVRALMIAAVDVAPGTVRDIAFLGLGDPDPVVRVMAVRAIERLIQAPVSSVQVTSPIRDALLRILEPAAGLGGEVEISSWKREAVIQLLANNFGSDDDVRLALWRQAEVGEQDGIAAQALLPYYLQTSYMDGLVQIFPALPEYLRRGHVVYLGTMWTHATADEHVYLDRKTALARLEKLAQSQDPVDRSFALVARAPEFVIKAREPLERILAALEDRDAGVRHTAGMLLTSRLVLGLLVANPEAGTMVEETLRALILPADLDSRRDPYGEGILNLVSGRVEGVGPLLKGWVTEAAGLEDRVRFVMALEVFLRSSGGSAALREEVSRAGLAPEKSALFLESLEKGIDPFRFRPVVLRRLVDWRNSLGAADQDVAGFVAAHPSGDSTGAVTMDDKFIEVLIGKGKKVFFVQMDAQGSSSGNGESALERAVGVMAGQGVRADVFYVDAHGTKTSLAISGNESLRIDEVSTLSAFMFIRSVLEDGAPVILLSCSTAKDSGLGETGIYYREGAYNIAATMAYFLAGSSPVYAPGADVSLFRLSSGGYGLSVDGMHANPLSGLSWGSPAKYGSVTDLTSLGHPRGDPAENLKGGIDLDTANFNLRLRRDDSGLPLPLAQQASLFPEGVGGMEARIMSIAPADRGFSLTEPRGGLSWKP